ncbi:hypothetical protein ABMA27_010827 [Loxostege sticticalis]|uniref:Neogenin n=1 Tax=Loxostege sticticalis TaxID=481309 RepID=A0ABR3H2C7_LOXSC
MCEIVMFLYELCAMDGGDELKPDPGVRFTMEPADLVVVEGEDALLPCAAAARHPVKISWRYSITGMPTRDQTVTISDLYRRQMANGSLLVEKMSSSLAGQYQCVAVVDGVGTIVSKIATLFLAELPTITPGPRWVSGTVGNAMLLTCALTAPARVALRVQPAAEPPDRRVYGAARLQHQPPTLLLNVTWLRNGVPVRLEIGRVSVSSSGALEIDPLRHHDAATYKCRVSLARRPHIYVTGEEVEVRVGAEAANEFPPRFVAAPHSLTVMEGSSVTFDCAAVGNPKPEMTWLNNGVEIDLSDLDSRFYRWGCGSLRVQSARALDAGAYTCRAHSRLDSADHTAHLHVQTYPRVQLPGGPVCVARARGDVTLACAVRGRPAPTVTWLKDGEPLTLNHQDIALVDGTSLRIQGVLGVDAGMFQCVAASPLGHAQASLRLVVLPPDDDPAPEELDFLGETSSAFTSGPELEYDYNYDSDPNDENDLDSFHAAEGLDLDQLRHANATVISPPKGLKAVIVKHRFVTLSWEEPDNKNEDISGYAVIYKVKGSERERVSRGGARHEMNVAALQPNTTYTFQVLAYTQHAFSPPTQPIEVTTPEEEVSHGAVRDIRVEATSPHTLRVAWAPPLQPPGAKPPDKYQVIYTEVETGREQTQWIDASSEPVLNTTIAGLRAAAAYSVRVAAAAGASSDEYRVRMPSDVPAAPPGNVTAVPTGATSILVRWEPPPARAQHGALTGYKVRYRALPASDSASASRRKADSLTTPADARRAELRGLDTATTYQIRVCAINVNGSGPFSEWLTATTQRQQLDETRVPLQPPPLTTRAGRDWISVWWSESGGGAGGVVVRGWWLGWGRGVPDEMTHELPPHLHSHVIRGLESNAEYVISLRGSNALGLGPAVYATVRTRAPPEGEEEGGEEDDIDEEDEDAETEPDQPDLLPPVGLKVIMLSGTTAVVYWTDPTLPKGQTATDGRRYVVRWAAAGAGGGAGRVRTYNASDLNCMLDDLRPNTHYEFAVKLIKGGRESQWSMIVSNTTLEAAPSSPPRELRVSPATPPARAADLSWAAPARPNGVITGYVIMYAAQRGGSEEWTALSVPGDRLRARVERLRPRTAYQFKVQARNSKGLGPFTPAVPYATALESGDGGGLASATSAWLWASAGGACAVLALAAALALSLCCRRTSPPLSPDTSTYQKSSASAGIKPPDLWIHHDQMELKHLDKSLHSSAISAGSVEAPGALASSTLTLPRAPPSADYEPARMQAPPAVDARHYVPTYVGASSSGRQALRAYLCRLVSHAPPSADYEPARMQAPPAVDARHYVPTYVAMTGVGVGVGVGCTSTCERRGHARHGLPDQSTPLLSGVGPLLSPQSSLASLHPQHPPHQQHPHPGHPPQPREYCGGTCPLGAACGAPPAPTSGGSDIYACAARERGHYVAYEPLGHYTHRDSLSSDVGGAGASGTLPSASSTAHAAHAAHAGGSLQRHARPVHSFLDNSEHSTPAHSRAGSARETSPYKKSASSSPGHLPNRLQLGGTVAHCSEELEPLTPSRSTERLHREMQNLEGLMKDLSAITQQQFHC